MTSGGGELEVARAASTDLTPIIADEGPTSCRASRGVIENEFRTDGPRPAAFCSDPFGHGFCVIGDDAVGERDRAAPQAREDPQRIGAQLHERPRERDASISWQRSCAVSPSSRGIR